MHVSTSLPAEGARASPVPPLRSTANKMGRRHRRQRTPKYHCLSALGHEETFTRLLPAFPNQQCRSLSRHLCLFSPFRANPTFYRDQPCARAWFPELLLFSTVRECEFCCGSWLFVDDESVNGHHFFSTCGSLSSRHKDGNTTCTRILLGSIRPLPRKTVQE